MAPAIQYSSIRLLLFLLLLGSSCAWSQNKWQVKADRLLEEKEYLKAIEYYEWAARDGDNADLWLGMGKAHRALRQFESAGEYFLQAASASPSPPEANFLLAQCLMSMEMPDSARHWFQRYGELVGTDARQYTESALDNVVSATPFDTAEFDFFKLPFNSPYSDFAPVLDGSDLIFCSNRPTETGIVRTSSGDGSFLVDLFRVKGYLDPEKRRVNARPYVELNTKYNEGPLCLSPDGQTLYLTQNAPQQGQFRKSTLNRLKIKAYRRGTEGDWQLEGDLSLNSPDYAVAHPTVVPDKEGLMMYFASDKPGGYGGSDLYAVRIDRFGNFTVPVNLGPNVNTPGDELFPFVHSDGDLYFASDGRVGFGGLDILRAVHRGDGWGSAQLLSPPINSPADDFGYRLDSLGENGFFSSNRGNKPDNDDMYGFRMKLPRFEDCGPQEENNYCYRFTEEAIFEEDDSVALSYVWNLGDGTRKKGLTVEHCYEKPGEYLVELSLMDTISNLRLMTQATYALEVKAIEQLYIWAPEQIRVGQAIEVHGRDSNYPGCAPDTYYWEVEGRPKGKGASIQLEFDAPGEYQVRLGIVGESDSCRGCVTRSLLVE